jgi:hypothetical protein
MRGVCRRYISDEQTVEDVLHDAFLIIFTSFDRLRDVRRAEPWMTAIYGPSLRPGVCYTPDNPLRKQIVPLITEILNK